MLCEHSTRDAGEGARLLLLVAAGGHGHTFPLDSPDSCVMRVSDEEWRLKLQKSTSTRIGCVTRGPDGVALCSQRTDGQQLMELIRSTKDGAECAEMRGHQHAQAVPLSVAKPRAARRSTRRQSLIDRGVPSSNLGPHIG